VQVVGRRQVCTCQYMRPEATSVGSLKLLL